MCPKHPMMDSARLFDWPACFQVFSNRPDKSLHQAEPIRRRTQWPFLKPRSTSHPFRSAPFSETVIQCDVTMKFHVIILSMKAEMHIRI